MAPAATMINEDYPAPIPFPRKGGKTIPPVPSPASEPENEEPVVAPPVPKRPKSKKAPAPAPSPVEEAPPATTTTTKSKSRSGRKSGGGTSAAPAPVIADEPAETTAVPKKKSGKSKKAAVVAEEAAPVAIEEAVVETAECAAVKISAAALDQTRIRERSVDGSGGKVPDDGIFAAVFVDSKDRAVTGTAAGLSSAVKDMIWTFREGTERIRSIGAEISKMVEDDKSRAVLVEFENRAFVVRAPAQSRAVE